MIPIRPGIRNLLLLAIILTAGLRLVFLQVTFFSVDEAVSAVAANTIIEGGLPYRDAIDHRGPLTYYAYALIFYLFGEGNMTAVHLLYTLMIAFQTWLVWDIAHMIWNPSAGLWAAICFAVFSWSNPFHEMWAAHTEWLLVLFSLLGVDLFVRYWRRRRGNKALLLISGILLGVCPLSKQVGVLDVGAVLGFIFLVRGLILRDWQILLKEVFLLMLGWAVPVFITIWYFKANNAWPDFVFYVWQYNTQFYLPEIYWSDRLEGWTKLFGGFFWNKLLLAGLLIVAFIKSINPIKQYFAVSRSTSPILTTPTLTNTTLSFLPILWLFATLLEAMSGGRAFLHYLIPAIPAMCLMAGQVITDWWGNIYQVKNQRILFGTLISVGLLFPLVATLIQHRGIMKYDASISEFKTLTQYIETNSSPEDRIFVWGFAPEIYILSYRRPASRFSFCNVLTGHLPAANEAKSNTDYAIVPGVWDTLSSELSHHCPLYIIDTQPASYRAYEKYPMKNYALLNDLINAHYRYDSLFHQANPLVIFHLYQRTSPCPKE